ncbi:MAG TPA: dihydrolipoamide acyltransferase, partial [Chloroflexota bacterium]|nr:dihydrolipoamide acyltransferase [Chloroflexota bacterium]
EGEDTIGVSVNITQLAPTPLGKRVRAEAVVTGVNGQQIAFSVKASDSVAPVAEGTLERVVVDREEFIWTAAARGAGR